MPSDDVINRRYLSGDYALKNPTWDSEDAPWKAAQALRLVAARGLEPSSIAEVGCGSGAVLAEVRRAYPRARLAGFDIAPGATRFWEAHAGAGIEFRLGDFLQLNRERFDLLLVMDVIEHVPDPFDFLVRLRSHARHHVFHVPLDLSALTVMREAPLLDARDRVGHIHYYTKGLAMALLAETGYQVLDWRYTGAAFAAPRRSWRTALASVPRRIAYALDKDAGVRLLGGETLIVLAQPADEGAPGA